MLQKEFITYLSSEKRFSEHTIKSYTTDLKQFNSFLCDEFQIINNINEVRFQMIRTWIASLLEKGIRDKGARRSAIFIIFVNAG